MTCTVEHCGRPAHALGLCPTHYNRKRRTDPTRPACTVGGCTRPAYTRGLCSTHYDQNRRGAAATPIRRYTTTDPTPVCVHCNRGPSIARRGQARHLATLCRSCHHILADLTADLAATSRLATGPLDLAACAGEPVDVWYRTDDASVLAAKQVCAGCPVRDACLTAGLEDHHGIWGGLTYTERRSITRRLKESHV